MTVKQYTLSQITAELGDEMRGGDVSICAVRPLAQTGVEHISFLANPKYKHEVHGSKTGAVIVSDKTVREFTGRSLIVAVDPYLYFAKVACLFSPVVKAHGDAHPTTVVEPSATVPDSCEIDAGAYIGASIALGEDYRILADAVVQHDYKLGNKVVLHPNTVVYCGYTLGNHVGIRSSTVIGADGFGLTFTGDSQFKIPQTGAITLGDGVEIGSNSNVDCGTMNDTTVGNDTKIDNQVQIDHNYKVGSHTVIATKTGISDSTAVGNYCIIGGGVDTVGHVEIADKTTTGSDTSVTHSITESGQRVAGVFPMSSYKEWAHSAVHVRRLNEADKRTKQLKQKLTELKNGKQAIQNSSEPTRAIIMEIKLPVEIHGIQEILPHRFPFLLADRVAAAESGKSLTATKSVTFNEQFFQGHFPELSVIPDVLIVEAMAQACGVLAVLSQGNARRREGEIILFAGLDNVCFKHQVIPGDQLVFDAGPLAHRRGIGKFDATVRVDNELAREATIMCAQHIVKKS